MSTAQTDRPATTQPTYRTAPTPSAGADRPTATYPTHPLATAYPLPEGWRIDPAGYLPGLTEGGDPAARLQEADATPTVTLPAEATTREAILPTSFPEVGPLRERLAATSATSGADADDADDAAFTARTGARGRARVYHTPARPEHEGGTPAAGRTERLALQRARTERRERVRRHLRASLAAIALAAALLSVLQAYAAAGISSARRAALAQRDASSQTASTGAPTASGGQTSDVIISANNSSDNSSASQTPSQTPSQTSPMSGQSTAQPDWVTEDTHAPYVRTNPHASPLELPRCTTSPDTPLPCLATISPSQRRAVVLEEDASLTALVRQ